MSLARQVPSQAPPAFPAPHEGSAAPAPSTAPRSLDDLAARDPVALASLYAGARTPVLPDMDGPLVGRMLAVPALPRLFAGFLRWLAAHAGFPWRGKTFTARDAARGDGI